MRTCDPLTPYRVYLRKDKSYTYAAVDRVVENDEIDETDENKEKGKKRRVFTLGRVKEMRFIPNDRYRLMPVSERVKLIFPEGIDISAVTDMNKSVETLGCSSSRNVEQEKNPDEKQDVGSQVEPNPSGEASVKTPQDSKPSSPVSDQYTNRLYGSFWLLDQIAVNAGLHDDLLTAFNGNGFMVNEVLSLGYFPYLSGRSYSRFSKWQNTHATLLDYRLGSPSITRLTQRITDTNRMTLIRCRVARLPSGALVDCDSTTRSAYGSCLADIRRGINKDNPKLDCTVEVTVYSLTTHQPFYYRSFPGNNSDISTIRIVLRDLIALGFDDVVFVADRGYISDENIAALYVAEIPFILCAKVGTDRLTSLLLNIKYDEDGEPVDMQYDPDSHLYYVQLDVPVFQSKLSDGTAVQMENIKANFYMNPLERTKEIRELKEKVRQEKAELEQYQKDNVIPGDIKKFNALFDYFKVTYEYSDKKEPVGIAFVPLEEKQRKEKARCGFFASVCYKVNRDALGCLKWYKTRDEHEKNHNQMKNQSLFYNQRNSTQDGKDGRSLIMFVGLIPISLLTEAWKTQGTMKDDYESAYDMLDEMESIRYVEHADGTTSLTNFTSKQVMICEACGVTPPYECIPLSLRKDYDPITGKKKSRKAKGT